jgi:hypothetical protein
MILFLLFSFPLSLSLSLSFSVCVCYLFILYPLSLSLSSSSSSLPFFSSYQSHRCIDRQPKAKEAITKKGRRLEREERERRRREIEEENESLVGSDAAALEGRRKSSAWGGLDPYAGKERKKGRKKERKKERSDSPFSLHIFFLFLSLS